MILYTPLSQDDIFPMNMERTIKPTMYEGVNLIVDETEGKSTVVQLLSTNPHDYMELKFTPGKEIELK